VHLQINLVVKAEDGGPFGLERPVCDEEFEPRGDEVGPDPLPNGGDRRQLKSAEFTVPMMAHADAPTC
jgi:hypothetical protein